MDGLLDGPNGPHDCGLKCKGRKKNREGELGQGRPNRSGLRGRLGWLLSPPQLLFLFHFLQIKTWGKRKKGVDREFDRDKNIFGVLETCTV